MKCRILGHQWHQLLWGEKGYGRMCARCYRFDIYLYGRYYEADRSRYPRVRDR